MPDLNPPVIDDAQLNKLGQRLFGVFGTYETDRRAIEERWLKNLRQYRGVYDPDVLGMIPADRSKAYPRMTAWTVKGTLARLMQIAFPQSEKNYGIKNSPMPDLSAEQLQQVLDTLVASKGGDPSQVVLADEEIEKAIAAFAAGKAERMELKVDDDFQEMDYLSLARKVMRSAIVYGPGILKGPLHRKMKARAWSKNPFTGVYTAEEVEKRKPLFEFVPVWNYYPDLTAMSLDNQDGEFERLILSRTEVQALADRPDFLGDRIGKYLHNNEYGNYRARWFESQIKGEPKSAQAPVQGKESRKFEALSFWGNVTGREIRSAGIEVSDDKLGQMFHANVWMIDQVVIKAKLAPFGSEIRHYHQFIFEDDDLSIVGNGLPETLRDSQLSLAETVRAALDNMSVIGPMVEINTDMLAPGESYKISKHRSWLRESIGGQSDAIPAVRNITVDSHLTDLLRLVEVFLGFADKESGLPPPAMGDTSGGGSEALRTSKNASMFLGAAALPVRDTLRNFDIFTKSVVSADVAWNKKYDANPTRDGDHDVITRASTSLVAKEVLSQQLEIFRQGLVDPEDRANVKMRQLLIARMKANDLPMDLLEDEDIAKENLAKQQQVMQAQAQGQQELVKAQVEEILSRAVEHIAKARSEDAGIQAGIVNSIIEALKVGDKTMAEHIKAANKPKEGAAT